MTKDGRSPARPARRLVINWPVVEQRRIAAGMAHAQLAERVGVAAVNGPVRLWLDRAHDTVRLGLLERLCQVLDLHPVELFTAPTRAHGRHTLVPAEPPSDGQVSEAALATLATATATATASGQAGPVSRADLATALGWPHGRLTAALADLDDALAGRGVRVDLSVLNNDRPVHGLQPRSGLLSAAQREALNRCALADQTLAFDEMRALYTIAQPDSRCTERHTVLGPHIAVRLQQLGLVRRRDRSPTLELADDVRDALLLDTP